MPDLKTIQLGSSLEGLASKDKRGMSSSLSGSESTSSLSDSAGSDRQTWGGKLDFIMSCVSYAVGLGNIWRFPYLCYRNGGAVFLVPYIFFLIVCGMPLFFMEVSYGQFASLSPITVWHISPLFKGIGYGMVLISGIVCIYYNVIITWTLYYLFNSFTLELPWATCNNEWNTPACALSSGNKSVLENSTISDATTVSNIVTDLTTAVTNITMNITHKTSPSEEFWENHVLQISDGIENMGGIRWELFGCLALAWLLVFMCLVKGVRSSGKVMYFTATFPYVVLICLLVRAATLDGAIDGVKYYVIPQWHKLLELKVWGEAAMQIFYSVGASWGALVTMASYNNFHHNTHRDALIIPVLNCGTSIFSGFVIFSIIGFMAAETGSTIAEVVRQGPGLVFVVYPEAVSKFPFAPVWAILFFAMLLSIGIGSQIAMFQTLTSAFIDEFDSLKKKKLLLTATLCLAEFLLGIPCITNGGIYYLQIMDWYSSTFSLMILSFTELVVISWVYGVHRFYKDIQLMLGFLPPTWWRILWQFITPAIILFVLGFSIVIHTPVTYGDYQYPGWAVGIGWIYALVSMIPLPLIAIIKISQEKGSLVNRIKKLSKHSREWGPCKEENRELYLNSLASDGEITSSEVLEQLTKKLPEDKLHNFVV